MKKILKVVAVVSLIGVVIGGSIAGIKNFLANKEYPK